MYRGPGEFSVFCVPAGTSSPGRRFARVLAQAEYARYVATFGVHGASKGRTCAGASMQ
jgi:hypothetical protein